MPAELAVDRFLSLLERSGIVPEDRMQRLLEDFGEHESEFDTSQKIAEELVARGVLTQWQSNMLLQGKHRGFILGSYRILKPLGRGGMGAVYLAEHQVMRRRCAIKVLPSNFDRESSVLDRFHREAQAVAALDHPNIVRAYDVSKCVQNKTELHYLVMEYIEGQDLQKMIEQQDVLGYREAAEYIRQAAEGLAHAHDAGFVHRDIKPANLLVDTSGIVKILDLGLARIFDDAVDGSLTKELGETVLGTADYLAPEQALDSHDVDARADIYSLGQTLYFLLKGCPPFPEGTVAQRLMAHQMKTPEPVIKTRPDAPPSLVAILDKMTAKKPEQRFQTAREVSEALKAWLEGNAEDSGFFRRASQAMARGATPVTSSAEPTHPTASSDQETELELLPIEEEQTKGPSSGTKLGSAASDSGAVPTQPEAVSAEEEAGDSSVASAADSGVAAADELQPSEVPVDLEELESLDTPSVPSPLESELPAAPLSGSGLLKSPSASGTKRQKKGKKTSGAEEKGLLARVMDSPVFWIGLAGMVVIVLLIAFLASRPRPVDVSMGPSPPGPTTPAHPESAQTEPQQPKAEPTQEGVDQAPDAEKAKPDDPGKMPGAEEPGPGSPIVEDPATLVETPQPSEGGMEPATAFPMETPAPEEPVTPTRPGELDGHPDTAEAPGRAEPTEARPSEPHKGPGKGRSKPEPPPEVTPADKKALFAGLKRLSLELKGPEKKVRMDPTLGPIIQRELETTFRRMKVSLDESAPAVLCLTLGVEAQGPYVMYVMSGELRHRVSESHEVTIWEHQQELGKFAGRVRNMQTLVRPKVVDFFDHLSDAHRQASESR